MLKPSGGIRSLPSLSAWGLQRRLLPLPVSVMLIFGCFLVQVVEGVLQKEPLGICRGRCPHRPADLPEDSNFLVQPHRNRPAEFARTSLSACGLPTPLVALACIGNVGIQAFSSVCGRLLFLRRLQDKPPLKGEGDQRSWWRGSLCNPPQQPTGFTRSYASFFLY